MSIMVFLLAVLVWAGFGYALLHHLLRITDGLLLIPLAPAAGYITFTILNNALLHGLPVPWVTWGVPLLMAAAALTLWATHRDAPPLQWPLRRAQTAFLLAFTLILGAILGRSFYTSATWDEFDHSPRAVQISQHGLPVSSYQNPDVCLYYHYGHNMNTGMIFRASGSTVLAADEFLGLFTLYTAMGLCLVFLWQIMQRRGLVWAALGSLLFLLVSPASWLTILVQAPGLAWLPTVFESFREVLAYPAFYINAWFARPLIFSMTTAEEQTFWVFAFTALMAGLALKPTSPLWHSVGLGILTAAIALVYTTGFPLIAVPIGIWLLVAAWQQRAAPRRALLHLAIYTVTTLAVLTVQGGVLTAALFCESQATEATTNNTEALTGFQLSWVPQYALYENRTITLNHPNDLVRFIYDWGVLPLLFPFILWYYSRRVSWRLAVLVAVAIAMTGLTFFVSFTYSSQNMARFATMSFWLLAGMTAPMLRNGWQRHTAFKPLVVLMVFALATSGLWWMLQGTIRPATHSLMMASLDEQVQNEWLGKLDLETDAVWDPSMFNGVSKGLGRAVTVFGTHSCLSGDYQFNTTDPMAEWSATLDPAVLLARGCNHLYIDREWFEQLSPDEQAIFDDDSRYTLVETWETEDDYRRLYRVTHTP